MSITSRIESIENHLKDDYVEIARLGADLTNVDKNIENIAEAIREAYSKMPKVLGTGSNVSLSPTLKGGLDITPIGACEQDSTTGKNKFPLPNTETKNGVTFTKNSDGTFNINGTASANTDFQVKIDSALASGNYTLSKNKGGTDLRILVEDYNGSTWVAGLIGVGTSTYENERTANISPTGDSTMFTVEVLSGVTINLQNVEVQLESGDSKTSFEKYTNGASPNPNYPQDIRVVTGDNDVVVRNKNLCNARQDSFSFNANDNANMRIININENLNKIHLLKDVKYYISYTVENNSTTNLRNTPNLKIGQNTNYYQSTASNFNTTSGRKVWEFTAPETGDYEVRYWVNSSDVAITISDFMISTSSDTTYSPYQAPQSVTLHNVPDLAGIGTYKDEIVGKTDDWKIVRKVRHLSLAIADMDNTENYPGWKRQTQVVNDLDVENETMITTNIALTNMKASGYIATINYVGTLYFSRYQYGNDYTQTYWQEHYPNLIFDLYYGITNTQAQTEEPVLDTTLISDLNNMYNAMGYDGQTNITITSNSANAQMTASVSALKGE